MKSYFSLVEKFLQILSERSRTTHRVSDVRAANLMLKVAHDRPTPPAQRKLRQRQRHAMQRLEQAREWKRQKRVASSAGFVNGLLIAAQYLVGATLASSFVQKSLSPNLTGTLGVLVVIASTVQQRYAPEVIGSAAKARVAKLRRIVVEAEDELVEANQDGNGEEYQRISSRLSETIVWIEASYSESNSLVRSRPLEPGALEGETAD